MNGEQLIDWLNEPRLPHHAPLWLQRLRAFPSTPPRRSDRPVTLGLTFDVEQDFGSGGTAECWSACEPFLDWLGERAARQGWRTTLFVQGSVVEPLAGQLRQLEADHELGLHGYYHEMWGRQLWFSRQEGTPVYLRRELLRAGLAAFGRAGLARPVAFRAPNLVCDAATCRLLVEAGFRLDSSQAAFRGCLPLVVRQGGLTNVPVSASPRPRVRRRLGLPTWAPYGLLNVQTFLFDTEPALLELVGEILAVQDRAGAERHLVVLAHPWEFADFPRPPCGSANRARLEARLALLADHYPLEFRPLGEIAARAAA
jgi:peptidoglycan/xylan/chitin deacetylase (PgdA/CDA1 family)